MAKNPNELANQMLQPKQETPTQFKRIRDVDDFQAEEFPDVDTNQFFEGYLKGDYDFNWDTEANEKLMDYIAEDLKLSPHEWNKRVGKLPNARRYSQWYLDDWSKKHSQDGTPIPRRSDVQVWRDRANKYASEVGDMWPFAKNFANLTDDDIQEMIDLFGFNRRGEW